MAVIVKGPVVGASVFIWAYAGHQLGEGSGRSLSEGWLECCGDFGVGDSVWQGASWSWVNVA